jgi:diguanylate cyclase (GGDEF)-like protein
VYSKLGQDFFAKNKLAEAIEGFEKALAIMPGSYAALKSLVDIYTQENRADKAIDLLKDQLASNPREIEILKLLGRAYLNAGMIDKAEKTFHRLWELDATCHYYFMAICRHCLKQGEPARAIAIIDRNSNLLIAHKQESEAISMLKEIAQEQTNRIAALKSIANIHALKCEKEKLLATLNDIVETAVNLAMREEAISALNRLIELKPQDRSYKLRLADLSGAQPHSLTTDAYVINFEAPIIEDSDETVHQEFELTDLFAPNLALQQEEFVELEPLTGGLPTMLLPDDSIEISSRRFFDEFLNREWRRAAREDKSLSLIIIEIDYFKAYMECYGQPRVDASLRQIARSLNNELKRPTDLLSHYSSRKFAFILPGTHAEGAFMVAERMRARIESLNIAHEHSEISKRVTISLGAAAITPPRKSAPKTLIDAAKQALTRAQRNGGNRTIIASIFGNSVSFTLDDDQSKSKNTSDANYDEDTDEMNMPIEHHFQPVSSSIPSSFFKR